MYTHCRHTAQREGGVAYTLQTQVKKRGWGSLYYSDTLHKEDEIAYTLQTQGTKRGFTSAWDKARDHGISLLLRIFL